MKRPPLLLRQKEALCLLRPDGFTLIELLVVVAVMGVLMSLAVSTFVRSQASMRLSEAGSRVVDMINTARASALARGLPAEVWYFVEPSLNDSGETVFAAMGARLVGNDGTSQWITRVQKLPISVIISPQEALSNLVGGQTLADVEDGGGKKWKGVGIRIYPNGKVEPCVGGAAGKSSLFLTLVHDRDIDQSPPSNFCAVQISPINGRVTTYRP